MLVPAHHIFLHAAFVAKELQFFGTDHKPLSLHRNTVH